jgi:hypothetical protein
VRTIFCRVRVAASVGAMVVLHVGGSLPSRERDRRRGATVNSALVSLAFPAFSPCRSRGLGRVARVRSTIWRLFAHMAHATLVGIVLPVIASRSWCRGVG